MAPWAVPGAEEVLEDQPEVVADQLAQVAVVQEVQEDIRSMDQNLELAEVREEAVVHIPCNPGAHRAGTRETEPLQGRHMACIHQLQPALSQGWADMADNKHRQTHLAAMKIGCLSCHRIRHLHPRHRILQKYVSR